MAVTIYTKNGCPHCASAKMDLEKRGIKFEEVNVSANPGRIKEMMRLSGGRKVPVVVVDGKVTVGHNGGG